MFNLYDTVSYYIAGSDNFLINHYFHGGLRLFTRQAVINQFKYPYDVRQLIRIVCESRVENTMDWSCFGGVGRQDDRIFGSYANDKTKQLARSIFLQAVVSQHVIMDGIMSMSEFKNFPIEHIKKMEKNDNLTIDVAVDLSARPYDFSASLLPTPIVATNGKHIFSVDRFSIHDIVIENMCEYALSMILMNEPKDVSLKSKTKSVIGQNNIVYCKYEFMKK